MSPAEVAIRKDLKEGTLTADTALPLVKAELAREEARSLLVLQGCLILLSEEGVLTLEDAQASFERAIDVDPAHPEAYEELGHLFDAVIPNREKSETFYRLALAHGAGQECRDALNELLAEQEE